MLRRRGRKWLCADEDLDPMDSLANLTDLMLVFACGLIGALVVFWQLQDLFAPTRSAAERQRLLEAVRKVVAVEQGKELPSLPEVGSSAGSGYQAIGTVYRDPKTGKLIMIED